MAKISKLNKPSVIALLILIIIGAVLFVTFPILSYFFKLYFVFPSIEQASVAEVKRQVAALPGVKLVWQKAWEGDSMATIAIKDKGEVYFWYVAGDVPRIDTITPYGRQVIDTDFQCEDKTLTGQREQAYITPLVISKDAPLGKLFPFEVRTIADLVKHYNDIVNIVDTFPKQTSSVQITNQQGTFYLPENPDPKYAFKLHPNDSATCYYYLMQRP
jgi:hypothetical protein